jgi:hypothetical protein
MISSQAFVNTYNEIKLEDRNNMSKKINLFPGFCTFDLEN